MKEKDNMMTKIQIDVIEKIENSQLVKCKLYINGEATPIFMLKSEYERLIQDGFFLRDGKSRDSAGVLNTTNLYKMVELNEKEKWQK